VKNTSKEHPAITEARRLLGARKGPPTETDRPRHKGRPPRVLDGQLDLDGNVHRANGVIEKGVQDAA
jgi:hypothetical protein